MMTVEALWRFPVKSMAGEMVATAEVTELGIVGPWLCADRQGDRQAR
jgi:uncharacterized protein YcbX